MDALAALRLQVEWGADEALDLLPRDRTRLPPPPPKPVVAPEAASVAPPTALKAPKAQPSIPQVQPAPVRRAQEIAAAATSVAVLREALASFDGCALAATATNLVFADGNPDSGLML
ncbi:MAG TPA: uracil-DNA glycosylase, partial [Acetobacteraceae bacterium]|nr:uracil-DNA glycosylase [Acetobacteraceae bacterium]